jgi:predicted enzyme related to lactoylglutathione lyase
MALTIESLVIDAHDPAVLASFWERVLGWRRTHDDPDEVILQDADGPELLFGRSSDDKVGKNRLHLDLRPDDQTVEVERVLALGATRADIGQGDDVPWVVLADPEGNEFCILSRATT